MRVPLSWLRDYVPLGMPTGELADRLSISAAEVNTIEPRGPVDEDGNLGLFLVGKVIEAGKHPNADRLQLCQVDMGEGRRVRSSAARGTSAPERRSRSRCRAQSCRMPRPRSGEAKLRGEVSEGMILAEDEIGLGTDHAGIMVLSDTPSPGRRSADVLPLADLSWRSSRRETGSTCSAIYGIAREVAAIYELQLAPPPGVDPEPRGTKSRQIRIDDFEGCPRYIGRLFGGVRVGPSPVWLRARLNGRRHAPDLQRRGHHELRHARARKPAPRLRPRDARRRPDRRPPGDERREAADARRRRARAHGTT